MFFFESIYIGFKIKKINEILKENIYWFVYGF